MRYASSLLFLALAGVLGACTHSPTLSQSERLALYRAHAGAPVMSFRLERNRGMQSWTPLGDQALAVWSSPNRGHLLELRTRCPGMLSGQRISITNSMGQVTRLDSVVPRQPGPATAPRLGCRIESIRPLDGRALREAKRELREAELIDRSEVPASSDETTPSG